MSATFTLYEANIERIAARYSLGIDLVTAVVITESSGQTDAFRHEPGYYQRYIKGKPEWEGWNPRRVASSYGLMQVMYPTALMNGWEGDPEELFLPDVGLNAGCARLRHLLDWALHALPPAGSEVEDYFAATRQQAQVVDSALAAYNGGKVKNEPWRPQLRTAAYVVKIKSRLTRLRKG